MKHWSKRKTTNIFIWERMETIRIKNIFQKFGCSDEDPKLFDGISLAWKPLFKRIFTFGTSWNE